MVGIILISHGGMAEGMMSSASMLYPELAQVSSLAVWPDSNPDEFQAQLEARVKESDTGDGVFILADIMGGTPCNRSIYSIGDKVRVFAGMSLAMLLSLLCAREAYDDIAELSRVVMEETIAATVDVNELLKKGS